MDWFALLPKRVQRWLVDQFLLVAQCCPGHQQGKDIYCTGCGLRMDAIQRAKELGALKA